MRAKKTTEPIRHETVMGRVIEFLPSSEEAAFIARIARIVKEGTLHAEDLEALVWSLENPLLVENPANPEVAYATQETHDNPAWWVMRDYIDHLRLSEGKLDILAVLNRHTLTVAESSERLGIHESAVRQAINARRLSAVKKGAQWFLDPAAVNSYHRSNRGPASKRSRLGEQLHVREGDQKDRSFRVKRPRGMENTTVSNSGSGAVTVGEIPIGWRRVSVLIKDGPDKRRLFILEPDYEFKKIDFGGFYIRGKFQVVDGERNFREALERWKAFEAI